MLSELNISDYTVQYIFGQRFLIAYLLGCWFVVTLSRGIRPIRRGFGYIFSSLWPMGGMLRRFAVARFLDSFGLLLIAGLSNQKSAELAIHFAANLRAERGLTPILDSIRKGSPIWKALEPTKLIPSDLLDQIRMAEDTGNVEKALHASAIDITSGSRHLLEVGVSLIETMLIVILGFSVIFGLIPLG